MKYAAYLRLRKGRAFTLVELLIVIIIIGILAGMMLISSGAAIDNAKAMKVISDIRAMKAAAMLYHAGYGSWPIWIHTSAGTYRNAGSGDQSVLPGNYFDMSTAGNDYWIGVMYDRSSDTCYSMADVTSLDMGARDVLASKAEDMGFYGSGKGDLSGSHPTIYKASDAGLLSIISK